MQGNLATPPAGHEPGRDLGHQEAKDPDVDGGLRRQRHLPGPNKQGQQVRRGEQRHQLQGSERRIHHTDPDEPGQEEDGVQVWIVAPDHIQHRQHAEARQDSRQSDPARPAIPGQEPADQSHDGSAQTDQQDAPCVTAGGPWERQTDDAHERAGDEQHGSCPARQPSRRPRLGLGNDWCRTGAS